MNFRELIQKIEEKLLKVTNDKLAAFHVVLEIVPGHDEVRIATEAGTFYIGFVKPDGELTDLKQYDKKMEVR